jgi:uncharacterized membrane protein
MFKAEHAVHIDASPSAVWAVLMDIERWPAWTPTMRKVQRMEEGAFGVGSRANITLNGLPAVTWRVTQFDDGRSFTWESERPPRVSASHVIEPDGGGAKLTLATDARGLGAVLFAPLLIWVSPRNIRREAAGLKQYCEAAEAK